MSDNLRFRSEYEQMISDHQKEIQNFFQRFIDHLAESEHKDVPDVHTRHCCVIHGCKYGDDRDEVNTCPVSNGSVFQEGPCEDCQYYD